MVVRTRWVKVVGSDTVHPATGPALPLEGISRGLLPGSPRGGAAADLTMAKSLREWIDSEVRDVRAKPMSWLSQYHFFRLMPIIGADAKAPRGCVPRVSSGREAAIWEGAVQVDRSPLDHVQLHGFLEGNGGWIQTRVRICCRPIRVRRCARRRDSVLVEVRRR